MTEQYGKYFSTGQIFKFLDYEREIPLPSGGSAFHALGRRCDFTYFEEFEATRSLLACDIGDKEGRQKILSNPNYIKRFEKDWYDKKIVSTFQRDLKVMEIDSCPVPEWCGETGQMIFDAHRNFRLAIPQLLEAKGVH